MNCPKCPQCPARGKAKLYWQAPRFLRCDESGAMYRAPFSDAADRADLYYEGWKSPIGNTRETGATDMAIANTVAWWSRLYELVRAVVLGWMALGYHSGRGLTPGVARYIRRSPRFPVFELVPVGR
jgi:hypothetical protein